MSACSFSRLLQFFNKQLGLDGQLEIYDHLERCDICRDAFCRLSRDREESFSTHHAHRMKPLSPGTLATRKKSSAEPRR